jgi:hypothetical protein
MKIEDVSGFFVVAVIMLQLIWIKRAITVYCVVRNIRNELKKLVI